MDDNQPEKVLDQLEQGYQEEIALYEKLLELSRRQHELLSREENERASEVVKAKEEVISAIGEIEARLNPARTAWPRLESGLAQEQKHSLEARVDTVKDLIQKVLEQDEDSAELVRKISELMREKMQKIRQNRAAAQAYQDQKDQGARDQGGPLFLDKTE